MTLSAEVDAYVVTISKMLDDFFEGLDDARVFRIGQGEACDIPGGEAITKESVMYHARWVVQRRKDVEAERRDIENKRATKRTQRIAMAAMICTGLQALGALGVWLWSDADVALNRMFENSAGKPLHKSTEAKGRGYG
jgi:hypothetical protein